MFPGLHFLREACCKPASEKAGGCIRGATHAVLQSRRLLVRYHSSCCCLSLHIHLSGFCVTSCFSFSRCCTCVWGPPYSSSVPKLLYQLCQGGRNLRRLAYSMRLHPSSLLDLPTDNTIHTNTKHLHLQRRDLVKAPKLIHERATHHHNHTWYPFI